MGAGAIWNVCMCAEGRTPEYETREEYCILSVRKIKAPKLRACNLKFETGQNLPTVLKIVTCTTHANRHKPLLLQHATFTFGMVQ